MTDSACESKKRRLDIYDSAAEEPSDIWKEKLEGEFIAEGLSLEDIPGMLLSCLPVVRRCSRRATLQGRALVS